MAQHGPLQLGVECLKAGYIDEAIEHLEQAAHDDPQDYRGFNFLGVAYAQKGMNNRAIGALEAALKLEDDIASVHYNLGLVYKTDGFMDKAKEHFKIALKLQPRYMRASQALRSVANSGSAVFGQACARHSDEPAVGVCSICHLPVCAKCRRLQDDTVICARCAGELPEDTWGDPDIYY